MKPLLAILLLALPTDLISQDLHNPCQDTQNGRDSVNSLQDSVNPVKSSQLPLEVNPRNGMVFVRGEVEGRPCRFLYDTGTTFTTLDLAFATNTLAKTSLGKAPVAPGSNVAAVPEMIPANKVSLGGVKFERPFLMALDLAPIRYGMGEQFDAILGMDVIASAPSVLSLKNRTLTLGAVDDSLALKPSLAPDALVFPAMKDGKMFPVLVDSGASFTFFNTGCWPVAEVEASQSGGRSAVAANGVEAMSAKPGRPGKFDKGPQLELAPLVMDGRENTIGSDTLMRYDLVIAPPAAAGAPIRFAFRPS